MYMYSSGDPGKIGKAKEMLYSSLFAILIVTFAYIFFVIFNPESVGK